MNLRRLRPARSGPSFGCVLTLPNIHGTEADVGALVRLGLQRHEIWSASLDLRGAKIADSHVWLDFAARVVDAILASSIPAPAAFAGFSIGGYLGWLIDRLLVAAGAAPTPVVNLDGGVLHLHWKTWRDGVAPLLPARPDLAAARMLLVHSARPGALLLFDSSHADWRRLDVPVASLACRTVNHPDFHGGPVIAAAAEAIDAFVETGAPPASRLACDVDVKTVGNRVFRALVAPDPPSADEVRSLVAAAMSVNANVMASLLFLAAATGDADLALDVAGRAMKVAPRFRPAAYAAVAVLRAVGRRAEATDLAGARGLAPLATPPPKRPWGSLEGVAVGSDASLDFAAAFCRAG